jgi:hypothetical protein
MVPLTDLWLPILLSAILVWLGSSVVWMVLPHHRSDYRRLPDEEAARSALRPQAVPPGQYSVPHAPDLKAMQDPDMVRKMEEGPAVLMTFLPTGPPAMGKQLGTWFVFLLVVGVLVAYLTGRTLGPGTDYLAVFRVSATAAWFIYGVGVFSESIWFGRPWPAAIKHSIDGGFYGLLTGGAFGWLWPA